MSTKGAHQEVATYLLKTTLLVGLLVAVPAWANVRSIMPDFYAEPGRHPFRSTVDYNESIDPFSGNLHLTHTDIVIPGSGGLDIRIQRSYNSSNVYLSRKTDLNIAPYLTQLQPRTPTGLGWTLHFGRVLRSDTQFGPCDTNSTNPNDDTLDNPVLETPDGRQQPMYVNSTSFSALFITKDQWVAYCLSGSTGLLVISPDGVKYTMNYLRVGGNTYTAQTDYAWYTTRIEDRNGNWIQVNYDTTAAAPGKEAVLSSLSTSDGRSVSFTYTDRTNAQLIRLTRISANGYSWNYNYQTISGVSGGYYYLASVSRPDGTSWGYQYLARSNGAAGNRVLGTVTHPHGASVSYNYDYECFMGLTCNSTNNTFYSLVVSTKTNGGRDIAGGTWTYNYSPSTSEDVTTVDFPGGRYVYRHYGSRPIYGGSTTCGTTLWRIGLLRQKETYNGGSLVHQETYTWQALNRISNEIYLRPPYDGSDGSHPGYSDCDVWAPVLTRKVIVKDGASYTTDYSNFDASYNPHTISESGEAGRTTSLTYFPRTANQNIVSLIKDEALSGQAAHKSVYRNFDGAGNLSQLTRHGLIENYTYHGTGDLYTKTNGRGVTWTYTGYYRGLPQTEQHPEGVTIRRGINSTGTIAWEDNGRGYRTSYGYNGLNRPTSITPPRGNAISIGWSSTGRTVTRGSYSQSTTFDGFGRPSYVNTNGITQDINYNELGFRSFESLPGASSGTSYNTDVLGRVTSASHPDSTSRAYTYSQNQVTVRNERNYYTTYVYRSFGDPDRAEDKALLRINAPEGVVTEFSRDIIGLPNWVSQGGITRGYTYDTRNCLATETHPETGLTTYGRDAVCNMTSRQVGSSGATAYGYDGLNRLRSIDYPGTTPDVTLNYDNNDNLTLIDNGVARRNYTNYDENDNLRAETLTVGSLSFAAAYGYNDLDYLSSITYPSLRQVSYAPDVLGRPTTVAPYVTSVAHHPNGVPASLSYANGHTATIDIGGGNRQWISRIAAQRSGTGYAMDLSYGGYDGMGNVGSITNALDASDSKSMSYDGIDRLRTAGTASIDYDAVGNIRSMTTSAGSLSYGYSTSNNRLESISGYRNASFGYDTYGNITSNGRNTFTYDDAGVLRILGGTTSATYDYDGKNMRVRTQTGSETTYHFYGLNGLLLGEYDSSSAWKKEYAYLGSKLVANVMFVPDVAPSIPSSITVPINSGTGNYTIAWGAATGNGTPITRYELEEADSNDFVSPSLVYSGLNTSTTIVDKTNGRYYYRVRACSGTACSAYRTASNGIIIERGLPGVPSDISVPSSSSTGTYTISWGTAVGAVANYELQESTGSSFCYTPPCPPGEFCVQQCTAPPTVYSGPNLSTVIGDMFPKSSGTYYYRVRACNDAGCGDYREGANGVTVTVSQPPSR